jgi:hypothetical protein
VRRESIASGMSESRLVIGVSTAWGGEESDQSMEGHGAICWPRRAGWAENAVVMLVFWTGRAGKVFPRFCAHGRRELTGATLPHEEEVGVSLSPAQLHPTRSE